MNAPWHNAATIRPPSMVPYVVARAETALPSTKKVSSATSTGLRLYRATRAVTIGPPITTLNAYAEISSPADGMETRRSEAISGSSPVITNSVIPIANVPIASAARAGADRMRRTLAPGS